VDGYRASDKRTYMTPGAFDHNMYCALDKRRGSNDFAPPGRHASVIDFRDLLVFRNEFRTWNQVRYLDYMAFFGTPMIPGNKLCPKSVVIYVAKWQHETFRP
jgi:hypothetical protein